VLGGVGDPAARIDREEREAHADGEHDETRKASRHHEDERDGRDRGDDQRCAGPAVPEGVEDRGRGGVRQRRRRRQLIDRHEGGAGHDRCPHPEGDPERPRRSAGDPGRHADHERRPGRHQVPLRDGADEHRGEEPDLDDEQADVGQRRRHESPCRRVALTAREHSPCDHRRRDGRSAEPQHGHRERMPQHLVDPVAGGGRARLADRCVGAEQPPHRELAAGSHDRDRDDDDRESRERAEPEQRPQSCPVASRERVDHRREQEGRQQDERLQAHRGGRGRPADEDAVAPHRGLLDRACQHVEGDRHDREREGLRHQEARVVQRRCREDERGGGNGPPGRGDPPRPRERRHRDE
jgi:hypothetical protein